MRKFPKQTQPTIPIKTNEAVSHGKDQSIIWPKALNGLYSVCPQKFGDYGKYNVYEIIILTCKELKNSTADPRKYA